MPMILYIVVWKLVKERISISSGFVIPRGGWKLITPLNNWPFAGIRGPLRSSTSGHAFLYAFKCGDFLKKMGGGVKIDDEDSKW